MLPDGFRRFASVTLIPGSALASLPKAGAGCSNAACPDLRRGLWATMIPTPTISCFEILVLSPLRLCFACGKSLTAHVIRLLQVGLTNFQVSFNQVDAQVGGTGL